MKQLLAAAATIALLASAGPVSAQMHQRMGAARAPSADPDASPNAGPEYRWMASHGYTVDDATPAGRSEGFSEGLNRDSLSRANTIIVVPSEPAPYIGVR
jgi:hypothetical protein